MLSLMCSTHELVAKNYKSGSRTGWMSSMFGLTCSEYKMVVDTQTGYTNGMSSN